MGVGWAWVDDLGGEDSDGGDGGAEMAMGAMGAEMVMGAMGAEMAMGVEGGCGDMEVVALCDASPASSTPMQTTCCCSAVAQPAWVPAEQKLMPLPPQLPRAPVALGLQLPLTLQIPLSKPYTRRCSSVSATSVQYTRLRNPIVIPW